MTMKNTANRNLEELRRSHIAYLRTALHKKPCRNLDDLRKRHIADLRNRKRTDIRNRPKTDIRNR